MATAGDKMTCTLCQAETETRYIDLFVIGSEGLQVCRKCENELSRVVLEMILQKQRERKAAYLKMKSERVTK